MRQKPGPVKEPTAQVVKQIRDALEGRHGEDGIAERFNRLIV
jgi:hypothetical protein